MVSKEMCVYFIIGSFIQLFGSITDKPLIFGIGFGIMIGMVSYSIATDTIKRNSPSYDKTKQGRKVN